MNHLWSADPSLNLFGSPIKKGIRRKFFLLVCFAKLRLPDQTHPAAMAIFVLNTLIMKELHDLFSCISLTIMVHVDSITLFNLRFIFYNLYYVK